MDVTIQVKGAVARILRTRESPTIEAQELLRVANSLGVSLEPLDPETKDPHLALYFRVRVPDVETAQRVISFLRHCRAIEAAYIKPPEELP